MQILRNLALSLLILAVALPVSAQSNKQENGRIVGNIIDGENGETLIGVSVYLEGTSLGAICDLDGNYEIRDVAPGTYSLRSQLVGYQTVKVETVVVTPGKETRVDFQMNIQLTELDEIKVVAKAQRNTAAAIIEHRRKSGSVTDAVSAETISNSGSNDAGDAVKQVVGASIEGGKYVVVRGLGGRYSKTQLNGSALPSTDPDEKAVQVDLIPAGVLDNVVIEKSFTPNKSGDFAGGSVNLTTRDYPENLSLKFTTSVGYNTESTLEEGVLTQSPSSTDWLGYDNGHRALPDLVSKNSDAIRALGDSYIDMNETAKIPLLETGDQAIKSFSSEMFPSRRDAPLNQSHSVSFGNKYSFFGRPLGVVASLNYKKKFSYYSNGFKGRYQLSSVTAKGLDEWFAFNDEKSTEDVFWGSLLTFKWGIHKNHKIGTSFMRNQDGEASSRILFGPSTEFTEGYTLRNQVLWYKERRLRSTQFNGEHVLFNNFVRLSWQFSDARSSQDEPDVRLFNDHFFYDSQDRLTYAISTGLYGAPERLYRSIDERIEDFKVDMEVPLGHEAKFSAGKAYVLTNRQNYESRYQYQKTNNYQTLFNGDAAAYFAAVGIDSVVGPDSFGGYRYYYANTIKLSSPTANNWKGQKRIDAYYGMFELPLFWRISAVTGVRVEQSRYITSTLNPKDTAQADIDVTYGLPALNLTFRATDNVNVRFAVSRTLAYPNLREVSNSYTVDFGISRTTNGNHNLRVSRIQNYDLRLEWFLRPGEIVAVSGFYKDFTDPIEQTLIGGATTSQQIQPKNADAAKAYGIEFEFRRRLDHAWSKLANFTLGGNLTLVHSEVKISGDPDAEDSELGILRYFDPDASDTRPLQGQSPYIVNVDLTYNRYESGTTIGLYYNVFGDRLFFNSTSGTPDVYEQSRNTLDFVASQRIFGPVLKFSVKNILNEDARWIHEDIFPDSDKEYVFAEYPLGVDISVGLTYSVW